MAIPTCDKTWAFSVNNTAGSSSTSVADCADLYFKLKNVLLSFGWTVRSSSDGSVAGNEDGADRWVTSSNVVYPGATRSWIVLQNTALTAKSAICIDCGASTRTTIKYSSTGFSVANGGLDGSTTAAPTGAANSSWDIITFGLNGNNGSDFPFRCTFHVLSSSDRECTRIIVTDAGAGAKLAGYCAVEKPKNPVVEWATPVFTTGVSHRDIGLGKSFDTASLYNEVRTLSKHTDGTVLDLYNTCLTRYSSAIVYDGTLPICDDTSYGNIFSPVNLACTTVGHRNWRKGQVYDLWWGSYQITPGTTYPATVGQRRKFVQLGQLIFPWNGLVTPDGTPIDLG